MLHTLAERCKETFIVASNPAYLSSIIDTVDASGLDLVRETESPARRVRHLVFRRR
jgi:hypothetical protein